jgi:hypothetical protein
MSNYSHENGGTWFKGIRPKPQHFCKIPNIQLRYVDVEKGDRWQCGECGQVWEVTGKHDTYAYDSGQGAWQLTFKKVYAPGVNDRQTDWGGYGGTGGSC